MFGQAIGAAIGGTVGLAGGAIQGVAQQSAAKNLRKRIRESVDIGKADTARQIGTVMTTPEYLAATKLLRGIYGIQGDPRADMYQTLQGLYGADATFGYGTKNYGRSNGLEYDAQGNLAANSHAAWNEAFLRQRFGQVQVGPNPGNLSAFHNVGDYISTGNRFNERGQIASVLSGQGAENVASAVWGTGNDNAEIARAFRVQAGLHSRADRPLSQFEMNQGGRDPRIARNDPAAAQFYTQAADAFDENAPLDTLGQDFMKGLRSAQMGRGLYSSQAGTAAEASALAAWKAQKQIDLLPQMMQLAENPLAMANRYSEQNLAMNTFQRTGGKAVYGQATEGAYGGSILGSAAAGWIQGTGQGAAIGGLYDQYSQLGTKK